MFLSIDFNDESLVLRIEPQPRDTSLFDILRMIKVGGTFSLPDIGLVMGSPVRLAAASVPGAITSPFATVLPFIQPRSVPENTYCSTFRALPMTE